MPLTIVVVTADYGTRNGQPRTGVVRLTATQAVQDPDDGETFPVTEFPAPLSGGAIAEPVPAFDDPPGSPSAVLYRVEESIEGSVPRSYYVRVPSNPPGSRRTADAVVSAGSNVVESATAAFTSEDVDRYVWCPAFPPGAVIVDVIDGEHAQLNAGASAAATGLDLVVGAQLDLSQAD